MLVFALVTAQAAYAQAKRDNDGTPKAVETVNWTFSIVSLLLSLAFLAIALWIAFGCKGGGVWDVLGALLFPELYVLLIATQVAAGVQPMCVVKKA